jgi:hypothetical protein
MNSVRQQPMFMIRMCSPYPHIFRILITKRVRYLPGTLRLLCLRVLRAYCKPGSDFRVLSLTSLYSKQLRAIEPVPFTTAMETQYDTDIACLPYTISPFTVLDIAHSLSYSDATINPNTRFKPSSIKPELVRHGLTVLLYPWSYVFFSLQHTLF